MQKSNQIILQVIITLQAFWPSYTKQ